MQHFKWTKAHAIFLPEVDAEHRNLFRMAEELHQAVHTGQPAAEVQVRMQSLIASIEEHFAHEERLMQVANCESYEWHRQQHDTLRKKARTYTAQLEAGDPKAAIGFVKTTARWFKDHMALTDRMMGAEVRNSERLTGTAS